MLPNIYSIVQGFAGLYVLYRCVIALNRMSRKTRLVIKVAYVLLVMGSAAAVAGCFVHRDFFNAVSWLAVALYLACNRRGSTNDFV